MDPNATLRAIRRICNDMRDSDSCGDLVELVEALDEWITKGGFLPIEWARHSIIRSDGPEQNNRNRK